LRGCGDLRSLGRPDLASIVIYKTGNQKGYPPFFSGGGEARSKRFNPQVECWQNEVARVFEEWRKKVKVRRDSRNVESHRWSQFVAETTMRASFVSYIFMFLFPAAVAAADYPEPKQGEWTASGFNFHTGEVLPEVKLHYTTVGDSSGMPVVVLHGTGGSAAGMLCPAFAGELFGPGQPLDASKYFIVIPDALGHGRSSKPSDGMKTKFP
jgi:hypothetical protein